VSHEQELAKEGLLDVVNGQLLVGGGLESFDEGPEEIEGVVDGGQFESGRCERCGRLDGGVEGGEHGDGSSPMRDILGHR
jgi:hypothetical protein